jgi:hypothetical protein
VKPLPCSDFRPAASSSLGSDILLGTSVIAESKENICASVRDPVFEEPASAFVAIKADFYRSSDCNKVGLIKSVI